MVFMCSRGTGLPRRGSLCMNQFYKYEHCRLQKVFAGDIRRQLSTQNGSEKNEDENGRNGRSRHYVKRAFLTVLVPYTAYALYIAATASEEIDRRENAAKSEGSEGRNDSRSTTLVKYSPLQILGRFANPFKEYRVLTAFEFFLNRVLELFQRNRGGIPIDQGSMDQLMPIHKPKWCPKEELALETVPFTYNVDESRLDTSSASTASYPIHTTWLGQSCNLIVYRGFRVLTDPLFSDFIVHETLGPKRITRMPAQIEDVPTPDVILVSHNHPDHLDFKSLKFWGSEGKHQPLWIVPQGMKEFMNDHGVHKVIELSWWQTLKINSKRLNFKITCTPAMHWSGRSLVDTNRSLWCSFLLADCGKPILFHAGDTGYVSDLFKRISDWCGPNVKLALLPCGQYCPSWHQKPRHICPEEVIKIRDDLKAQTVLGVHWGTFVLSGEYFREPKEKLETLAEWRGIRDSCFCPELGQTITIE
ncbi:LAMI_0E08086g1_1 [Lachancea mirantina]|uniref:LAMI_0E08086g1_1 n=1 Tax=Lachancea mirantina TaxID=1230905 RepID=A0A1G4JMS5_9SACH|nr:LAMI_0E08086g1_1 [Lachancea mirantina]